MRPNTHANCEVNQGCGRCRAQVKVVPKMKYTYVSCLRLGAETQTRSTNLCDDVSETSDADS